MLLPEVKVHHLMLRADVVDAVRAGRFHLYAVSSIDGGLALLSGLEAADLRGSGRPSVHGSFNAAVEAALAANVDRLKHLHND